ncbi:hypothetical protein [Halarcobacter sp.]|uniref:hypothetical protein n=1 Tax=Halarcobacter sp. TaxID=2321133 RepID=UPI003B00E4B7
MHEKYYIRVHIESAGTPYQEENSITKSLAGHMWFETYKKDEKESISDILDSGYTKRGIKYTDRDAYLGNPTYSSKEIEVTKEQYEQLKKFAIKDSQLAEKLGFGNKDYNVLTNSCIDFTWKALELAGINKSKFEGDLIPIYNRDELNELLDNAKLGYYIDSFINLQDINKIETENFYNLPKETQSLLASEGKHPSGPKWNSFINEMLHYHLNNQTKGIQDLKELSLELTNRVEQNKEEKIENIEKEFEIIDSKITLEERLQCLREYKLISCFDNNYARQLLEQYQDKVIENQGKEVSSLDFINMGIKQEEKRYLDFEALSINQNSNSQIQTMS